MHNDNLANWQHSHDFHGETEGAETSTKRVVWLTVIMMVIEIAAGLSFGSMALLADGWHMGTHAAALGITVFAYQYARRHAANREFSFGTGKVSILGGYTSAIVLAIVALLMIMESIDRLLDPKVIQFDQAIGVAVLGLVVNLVSAFMLQGHHHSHDHYHSHAHHHDHNLRAAYLHVIADALTSVLAIVALIAGKAYGMNWMDPAMGIVGALIISHWAYGLAKDTANILLDRTNDRELTAAIVAALEGDADNKVADLHVWQLSSSKYSVIISVVTHNPRPSLHYKKLLDGLGALEHVTVEVHACAMTEGDQASYKRGS